MFRLETVVSDIAAAVQYLDRSGIPHKGFKPGVGPYGEPQLVGAICRYLNSHDRYKDLCATKRTPDLLIRGEWAIEVKIARPFGDNGKEAEDWSVNLLHPYAGNTSAIGDCLKLQAYSGPERKASLTIGYEHKPPRIDLTPLFESFEAIMSSVINVRLGPRIENVIPDLIHPVHQQARVVAWEVF